MPQVRPRAIGEIKKNDIVIGRVLGINTIDFSKLRGKNKEVYIKAIQELKLADDKYIYFEEEDKLEKDFLDTIRHNSGLVFREGYDIRLYNVPFIIKEIYNALKRDINSGDLLIISSSKDEVFNLIQSLVTDFNFFTVHGMEESKKEEVYEEILVKTGVSIFQPSNIDRILKNYSTIINFSEEKKVDLNCIRNQALIIDFCKNKPFKLLENSKKNVILIEDISLKVDNYNEWITSYVSPSLFESLGEERCIFSKIYTNNEFYNPSDFVRISIKKSGRI